MSEESPQGFPEDASETRGQPGGRDRPAFLADEARIRAYRAIAALVGSGLTVGEAAGALAATYRRREDTDGARAVASFFGEPDNFASAETVARAAAAAFGPTFVTAEEEAVLCALSDPRCDPASVIEAAAGLIPLRQRGGPVARAGARQRP